MKLVLGLVVELYVKRIISGNLEDRRFPEGAWRLKNHRKGTAIPPLVFSNSCFVRDVKDFICFSNLLIFER